MKQIPSLIELYNTLANDLRNKLNLTDDDLRKVADAITAVLSAQLKLQYLYLVDIQNNLFPDTADLAEFGGQLERLGLIYLNRQPNPASAGVYTAQVFGEVGSVIRSGLTFKSNDDSRSPGLLYVTDDEYILLGANDFIEIRALTPGLEGALDVANELTITEPVIGVDQTVAITVIVTEPKAPEDIDAYRLAIINAIQLEPQGGAKTDYRLWASDAQGVRKVYPYVKEADAGVVQVYVEATTEDSTDGKGTPSAALLVEVAEVIELDPDVTKPIDERGRRPIQAELEVLPIALKPVDVEIIGLDEDTPAIQAAIESNLIAFLNDIRPFIAGGDLARNKNDILYSARLQSVITDVIGSSNFFTGFTMSVDGNVVNSFIFELNNIPELRNIVYS